MSNVERLAFEREARSSSVYWNFEMIRHTICRFEHEFCDTLDDATLAIALIGADDDSYFAILYVCMSDDRRERILEIIGQSYDVTEEDMEAAQLLIYDAVIKYERAYYVKNHIFSWYDATELDDIECLTIPDGILEIEDEAFAGYVDERNYDFVVDERSIGWWDHTIDLGIQTVVFPDSLKRIGDWAFSKMVCLKNIHFGNSLEHIGDFAFCNCHSLEKIELPGSIKDIGKSTFDNCIHLKSVKLSEGIEVIPEKMFNHCTGLREVILPSTLKKIGDRAFFDCYDLEKIDLPEGLTVIEEGLFSGCCSMKEIYIPKSVTQIEDDAFGSGWEGGSCEEDLVVICHQDSFAHKYAIENNLKFRLVSV